MFTIHFTDLPDEVVAYAFDQFDDRLHDMESVQEYAREADESRSFSNDTVEFDTTIVTAILRESLYEKVDDIAQEVQIGERKDFTLDDVERMRLDIGYAFDVQVRIEVDELPEEVKSYGFDQFPDRIMSDLEENIAQVTAHEQIRFNYEEKRVEVNDFVLTSILRGAMYEKVDDLRWEVKHGERTDYERRDIRRMRQDVRSAFEGMIRED